MDQKDLRVPPVVDEAELAELFQDDPDMPTLRLLAALEDMAVQALWNLNAYMDAATSYRAAASDTCERAALEAFVDFAADAKTRWPNLPHTERLTVAEQLRQWAMTIVQTF